jgi:hypothetical protein
MAILAKPILRMKAQAPMPPSAPRKPPPANALPANALLRRNAGAMI